MLNFDSHLLAYLSKNIVFHAVIVYKNAIPDVDGDQMFPETLEDLNGTFTSIPAQIMIPQGFLREQMEENREFDTYNTVTTFSYNSSCIPFRYFSTS